VWLDMDDVEELLFSELELPRVKPKASADAESHPHGLRRQSRARARSSTEGDAAGEPDPQRQARPAASRGGIEKPDLRYLSYRELPKPWHKAVVFLAMDVSGSMDATRKRMARLLFYWCVQFLRRRYQQTEMVFIAHTTEAREVTEHEFFNRSSPAGPRCPPPSRRSRKIQR